MFLEQIKNNRDKAFIHLVETKKQDINTITINDDKYTYKTKRGIEKVYIAFNSFEKYKKSELYPKQCERINGFIFVME